MTIATSEEERISWHVAMPSIPGMFISRRMRSYLSSRNRSIASSPERASATSYPCTTSVVRMTRRIWGSSSTTRILPWLMPILPFQAVTERKTLSPFRDHFRRRRILHAPAQYLAQWLIRCPCPQPDRALPATGRIVRTPASAHFQTVRDLDCARESKQSPQTRPQSPVQANHEGNTLQRYPQAASGREQKARRRHRFPAACRDI